VRDGYDGRENYNAVSMLLKYRPIWPAVAIIKSEICTFAGGGLDFTRLRLIMDLINKINQKRELQNNIYVHGSTTNNRRNHTNIKQQSSC